VTEQKAGYITADTCRSKVSTRILAKEVRGHYSFLSVVKCSAKRTQSNTAVARRTVLVRVPHHAQGQVGQSSRIGSKFGHRIVSEKVGSFL